MKLFFLLFFTHFIIISWSQSDEIDTSSIFLEYKTEVVTISLKADSLKIVNFVTEKKRYSKIEDPKSQLDWIYEGFSFSVRNIIAHVYNPIENKKSYKLIRISGKPKTSLYDGSTFYDDKVFYEIDFNTVKSGGYTELSYYKFISEPHFLLPYVFTDNVPCKEASYTIILDAGIEIGWHLYGLKKDNVTLKKSEENGKTKYTWTLKNSEPVPYEKGNNGYKHIATHIVPFIKSYSSNGTQKKLLSDTDDLFNWYQELIGKIKPSDNSELQKLTHVITQGAESETEKAQRIFHWVQENIRYIAIEDGWRGYIPFPAADISQKRYGDCKDMTHLMYEIMKIAGLNAEHAWIGTRELPYQYSETPSPVADNHLILLLFIDSDTLVLDATDSHTPFGIPTSFILGKEALFKNKDGNSSIYKIPEYSSEKCPIKNEIKIETSGKNLIGSAFKEIESFEYSTFQNYKGLANTEREQFVKSYLELEANNVILKNIILSDTTKKMKTKISYDFEMPNYILGFDNTFIINLNLTKPFSTESLQLNRKSPYEIDYKHVDKTNVSFAIPEGKTVKKLPADVSFMNEFGTCIASYRIEGNNVIYTRLVSVEKLLIQPTEIENWNNFLKKINDVYKTKIEYN